MITKILSFLLPFSITTVHAKYAYDLAHQCVSIHSESTQKFIAKKGKHYTWSSDDKPSKFYLRPSNLGKFILYDVDGDHFKVEKTKYNVSSHLGPNSIWKIKIARGGKYYLKHNRSKIYLNPKGRFHTKLTLKKYPQADCRLFPEASVDALVDEEFYRPNSNSDLKGYVDLHTHLAFPKTMGSLAMSGDLFHPLGIEHALGDCREKHGENGSGDLLGGQTGDKGHKTDGYPRFSSWPNRGTTTHVMAYHKWLERAYLSGLRIVVTDVTGNPTLCEILGLIHFGKSEGNCDGIAATKVQTEYIYKLQNYIDAQSGGPGKGWFRIVTSAEEAREVVEDNKLAVVLGIEHGSLFNCNLSTKRCTESYIKKQLQLVYDMGIRSIFPVHRFDNVFAGSRPQGGLGGAWMNFANKITSGRHEGKITKAILPGAMGGNFWEVEKCELGLHGPESLTNMKEFVEKEIRQIVVGILKNPFLKWVLGGAFDNLIVKKLRPLSTYKKFADNPTGVCNKKGLTKKGVFLLKELMAKGMIIEVDHLSQKALEATLEVIDSAGYPGVVSSHNWLQKTDQVRQSIYKNGGILGVGNGLPSEMSDRIQQQYAEGGVNGVAFGTDVQGVAAQARADEFAQITYPFTSYDGHIQFLAPQTGQRSFDYHKEGVAHYGLLAEWMENLRQVDERDGTNSVELMMNSARTYIEMWEKAQSFL